MPKNFNDAQQIADKFKVDIPVIVNLQGSRGRARQTHDRLLQRPHVRARRGHAARRRQDLLLTPRNVEVSAEEKARLLEKGFFNQF